MPLNIHFSHPVKTTMLGKFMETEFKTTLLKYSCLMWRTEITMKSWDFIRLEFRLPPKRMSFPRGHIGLVKKKVLQMWRFSRKGQDIYQNPLLTSREFITISQDTALTYLQAEQIHMWCWCSYHPSTRMNHSTQDAELLQATQVT